MRKMKLKILPKTFIGSLSLVIGILVLAFVLISVLTPRFYRTYKEEQLNKDMTHLVSALESRETTEIIRQLEQFTQTHEYGVVLYDQSGNMLFSRLIGMMVQQTEPAADGGSLSGSDAFTTKDLISRDQMLTNAENRIFILHLSSSAQSINEAGAVLLRVMLYVLLISLGLGAAVSLLYAKTITAPVKSISRTAFDMRTLESGVRCDVRSSDEIGELAVNINELYGRLLAVIGDLQKEVHNVASADKEKTDFMLAVSHELKTPLTSVKGMLEGMIYNVGVFRDRDEYLARCAENIDALASLVNEFLDASKLELSPAPEDFTSTSVEKLVRETAAIHEIVALSKQIAIDIAIDEDMMYSLPAGLFSKALSNIISNAVRYADKGGEVNIYTDEGTLIVENTCDPLPPEEISRIFEPFYSAHENGGHGLGLYLTERILKVCGLSFEFVPFSVGMRFVIFLD